MTNSLSAKRMVENEVAFRQFNEKIQQGFDELNDLASKTGQTNYAYTNDDPLYYICECSDENCRQRVQLKPSMYNKIHAQRDRFVIVNGHETRSIEKVIGKEAEFSIVEKFMRPPEVATKLNKTETNNRWS